MEWNNGVQVQVLRSDCSALDCQSSSRLPRVDERPPPSQHKLNWLLLTCAGLASDGWSPADTGQKDVSHNSAAYNSCVHRRKYHRLHMLLLDSNNNGSCSQCPQTRSCVHRLNFSWNVGCTPPVQLQTPSCFVGLLGIPSSCKIKEGKPNGFNKSTPIRSYALFSGTSLM